MAISASITRVKHVRLRRDSKDNNNWLVSIPDEMIQALRFSIVGTGVYSGSLRGTSFAHHDSVAIWGVGGGTTIGGTVFGIFIGTGRI